MFKVERITTRPRVFDFGDHFGGRMTLTSLVADDVELFNATERIDSGGDPGTCFGVVVCDCCGTASCGGGNRATWRRLGGGLVLMPCFDRMEEGEWESHEYRPPHLLERFGAPYFEGEVLTRLISTMPNISDPGRQPPLRMRDVARLLQWEAPEEVVDGTTPSLRFRREAILAVSFGVTSESIDRLEVLLAEAWTDERPCRIVHGEPIHFFLDSTDCGDWQPLVSVDSGLRLALAAGLGFEAVPGQDEVSDPRTMM